MAGNRHVDESGGGAQARAMLAVCGISHNTATLSEREPFQISRQDHIQALRELKSLSKKISFK